MNNNNLKDYFFINLISILIPTTFIVTIFIFRIGLENKNILLTFKALAISYFIILFPFFLSETLSFLKKKNIIDFIKYEPFFLIAGLLLIIIISLISPFLNLWMLIVILGFIFLLFFLIVFIKNRFFVFKDLFIIALVTLFSLFTLFALWSSKFLIYYSSPIFYEKLFTGKAFIDPIFHGAVANMIKNYGVPSTGLHGTIYFPYHYLSHWIFAQFSKLLNVNTLLFYQIGYPLIFLPLFLKLFLLAIKKIANKAESFMNNKLFWFLLLLIFTGVLPKFIMERFFVSHFIIISESYNLSLTFSLLAFLMIAFFESKSSESKIFIYSKSTFFIVILPLLLFLTGLSKSSTMIMFVVVLSYIFIRYKCYKKLVYNLSAASIAISSFFLFKFVVQEGAETSEFQLFHFFTAVIQGRNEKLLWPLTLILFIIIYFLWSIIFIILKSIDLKTNSRSTFIDNFRKKKTVKIEIIVLLCFIGVIPGIILKIHGGSANYFSELQKWVSIVLLLSLIFSSNFINIDIKRTIKKSFKVLMVVIIIVLISSIVYNFYIEFKSFYDDYRQNKEEYNTIKNNNIEDNLTLYRIKLIEVLLELDKLSINEKRDSLLYIPVDNTEFWDLKIMPKSLSVPLLVPAVSGIAMIYGLPDEGLIYVKQWGYSVYRTTSKRAMDKRVEELFYEIKQRGYKNLILLSYKNGEFFKDFINESNIEQYEGKIYKLFRRLYYYSFGESIKSEELHNIVASLITEEMTLSEVIPKIILNDESLINLKDDKDFIEFLYLVLLDRKPDEKGLYHWISEIENGRTRKEIINFFLNSPEFIQNINI